MPDRMPTQIEIAVSNALLECGLNSTTEFPVQAAATLIAKLGEKGWILATIVPPALKQRDPVFFPPLDADEKRLWRNVYAAAVVNAENVLVAALGDWGHVNWTFKVTDFVREFHESLRNHGLQVTDLDAGIAHSPVAKPSANDPVFFPPLKR